MLDSNKWFARKYSIRDESIISKLSIKDAEKFKY